VQKQSSTPEVIAMPASLEELQKLVQDANKQNTKV
jgi:hypothetical protein